MCNRLAAHIERGTAFRRATMWTLNQIMEAGAMGVQITISGKLRGDRSAFEKHTQGILPRAGNYAKDIVSEDITHTKTPMGLIGIKIRIARKEKVVPEFILKELSKQELKNEEEKSEQEITVKTESEQIKNEEEKSKQEITVKTESEQIKIEEEKMKKLVTLEEEEQRLK
jgi:small subunit ribosomal protein S3